MRFLIRREQRQVKTCEKTLETAMESGGTVVVTTKTTKTTIVTKDGKTEEVTEVNEAQESNDLVNGDAGLSSRT